MKVGVVGCGNVGFNTAKLFSILGHEVSGFDVSSVARERLENAIGALSVASSLEELMECQVVFECLPTDPDENGICDLTLVEEAVLSFASFETRSEYRCQLFVQRSTCPPGTATRMSSLLTKTEYVVNPSFLRKISQWEDTVQPERVAVAGSVSSVKLLADLYNLENVPIFSSQCFEVVELLKYAENITDAILISLWNELLSISDELNVPRSEFGRMMNSFGDRDKFRTSLRVPGQAFGLWCLPKDITAIAHEYSHLPIATIKGAIATNIWVSQAFGENRLSGPELFEFSSGAFKLTELGMKYLESVRIELDS